MAAVMVVGGGGDESELAAKCCHGFRIRVSDLGV